MDRTAVYEEFLTFLYIEPTPLPEFPFMVIHPIFEYSTVSDTEGLFNIFDSPERFDNYLKFYREQLKDYNIEDFCWRIRKQYRLFFIYRLYRSKALSKSEASDLIIYFWNTVENISNDVNFPKHRILSFLKHYAKRHSEEERSLNLLSDKVTIYRGCTEEGKYGFSWTTNLTIAETFASRFGYSNSGVFTTVIDKQNILMHLPKSESEVIVDYTKLTNVQSLD